MTVLTNATAGAVDVELDFTGFHAGQREVAASRARFRVWCAGRRTGKTTHAVAEALARAVAGQRVWWVAPTYKLGAVGWRLMRNWATRIPGAQMRLVDKRFTFPSGGWLEVRTAGAPGLLRGEGLDFLVFDEAAQAPEESWSAELRPALSDRKGSALFISTPRGRANWFYKLYLRGQEDDSGEWQSWKHPTSTNPHIDPDEIEAARLELPSAVFDQEFLAEFNDAGSVVFAVHDVQQAKDLATGLAEPVRGNRYVTAWDVARKKDALVGITIDWSVAPYQVVAFERELKLPYAQQKTLIERRAARYPGRTIVESNGVGDPLIGFLDIPVEEFVTTARSKVQAIQALQVWIEAGGLGCDVPKILEELEAYQWADTGIVQDCVMALAFAAANLPVPERSMKRITIPVAGLTKSMSGGTKWEL